MKGKRILSTLLALVMVLGLLTAFPSLTVGIKASAALTNLALNATYRGADGIYTNGTSTYGDGDSWNAYHTGKLNNGTIGTTASSATSDTIELSIGEVTSLKAGTMTIYYKLSAASSVSQVNIFANRRDNAYRGYPDSVSVYVGYSESDVSSSTLLGTMAESSATAYNSSAYVKQYAISGTAKKGTYVIIQMTISYNASTSTGDGVVGLTEVQVLGSSSNEAGLDNIAVSSTYMAASNCEDNADGTWGEADWNTAFHSGKLNDGAISTTYTPSASDTTKEATNIEFWLTDFVAGKAYIYFKLPGNYTVSQVNLYANIRNGNASRGYPTDVKIYVGNSQTDISQSTMFGSPTASNHNTYVKNYTAKGLKNGSYVILELGVDATQVVLALTEVEIFGVPASGSDINAALSSSYKAASNCVDNGDVTWGEANWNEYHTGKLTDGAISTTYTPSASDTTREATNIEFWLTDFVSGTAYIYFKLPSELMVSQVNLFANIRNGSANRGYPTDVKIYVGNSETDISDSTLLGTTSYTAHNTYVRNYATTGSKLGSYVILALGVDATQVVLALSEVQITAKDVSNSELTAPVLSSNTGTNTYTVPTISWAAVPGATSYDVYLNGELAVSNTTALSYTPNISTFAIYDKYDNRAYEEVYVVAKADGLTSATSDVYSFRYVDMPTDKDGNPVSSADFILDAGHGGTDSGASYFGRNEKDDNLLMAKAVGTLLEQAGFSVAYTRLTDVFDSPATKLAKGEAGNFSYYLSFHRNAYTDDSTGVMYLYKAGNTTCLNYATAMETEFVADGIWKNLGEVERDDLTILNGSSVPTLLLELGFVSAESDNALFDTYFNETAQAVARGAIKYAGYTAGYQGYLDLPTSAEITNGTVVSSAATVGNAGDTAVLNVKGWLLNSAGVEGYYYSVDDGEPQSITAFDRSGELGGYTYKIKANSGYSATISTDGWTVGAHTVKVYASSVWGETTKHAKTVQLAEIAVIVDDVTDNEYTVTFIGKDGAVISTQSVLFGQSAIAPEAPVVEGYDFKGWDKSFDNVTDNLTVTAIYEIQTFTVTFIGYEGVTLSNQTVQYGGAATAPDTEVEGVFFRGWDTEFDNVTKDLIVTAKYSIYVVEPSFDIELEASVGDYDLNKDGITESYVVLDVFLTNIDSALPYGLAGIDGYLYFDETALTPYYKTDKELNGSIGASNPKVIYNWPTYDQYIEALDTTIQLYSAEGLAVPYAYVDSNGNISNTDPANPEQSYTMGQGYVRFNYIIDLDNHAAYLQNGNGLFDSDKVQLRYYFVANDGALDVGETFEFSVPDSPNAVQTADALLRAPYSTGADDNNAFATAFGRGASVTLTVEEKTYTVTFVDYDGTVIDTQTVIEGGAATAPADPTRDGFSFTGWDNAFDNVTSDITVTAQYEEIVVTPAEFFTFADTADTAAIVKSTVSDTLFLKTGGMTGADLKAAFVDTDITITKANGTTAVADTALVGTTCLITSTINGESKTLTVVAFGDITGDGKVSSSDYAQALACAKGNLTLTGAKFLAANVAGPTVATMSAADYGMILSFAKGSLKKFNVNTATL